MVRAATSAGFPTPMCQPRDVPRDGASVSSQRAAVSRTRAWAQTTVQVRTMIQRYMIQLIGRCRPQRSRIYLGLHAVAVPGRRRCGSREPERGVEPARPVDRHYLV